MFVALGHTYFEIGDKVTQNVYPGAGHGTVIKLVSDPTTHQDAVYLIEVDVTGTEWAVDENGDLCNDPKTYHVEGTYLQIAE